MKLYEIFFSPTGGTEKVADILAKPFGIEIEKIDLSAPDFDGSKPDISADDICIIAAPSYGGRVPSTASARLASLHGNDAKAVLVAVYGNREFEDTLVELKNVAQSANFIPFAAVAAIAEHSILRKFAAGRPDTDDEAELTAFAEKIATNVNAPISLSIPGNVPYKESKGSSMKPTGDESCIQCGLCAEQCPVHAIPSEHPEQTDVLACISCMRCISICPVQARGLAPEALSFVDQFLTKVASERKANQLFL